MTPGSPSPNVPGWRGRRSAATVAVLLTLATVACSDDGESDPPPTTAATEDPAERSDAPFPPADGDEPAGFSPCDLLDPSDVRDTLPWVDSDEQLVPVRQLARYQDGIDACRMGREIHVDCGGCDPSVVDIGIHAGDTLRSYDDIVDGLSDSATPGGLEMRPAEGVGDRAVVRGTARNRYELWAEVDGTVLLLSTDGDDEAFDDVDEVTDLAGIAAGNLPTDADLGRDRSEILPDTCDNLDRDAVDEVLGSPVVLARGSVTEAGIVCEYQADSSRTGEGEGLEQVGLRVAVRPASSAAVEFLDDVAAGDYGRAEEISGVGERAVLRPEEAQIGGMVRDDVQLDVEGFLAHRDGDAPEESLIRVAESAVALAP